MILLRYNKTFLQENTYVVADENERQAIVVDPGAGSAYWLPDALRSRDLTVGAVILTHGHSDHVWDLPAIADGVPVYIAQPDRYRLADPEAHTGLDASAALGLHRLGAGQWREPEQLKILPPEIFQMGITLVPGLVFRALPTPGHTRGSTAYLCEGTICADPESPLPASDDKQALMFGGDVLFAGGVGRTDLPGGDEEEMRATLRLVATVIRPETIVCPGHGPMTTIFQETRHNALLRQALS